MTVPPSKTLERYQLVDRIAVGGMAEVYRAVAYGAHGFEKPLAIKRILPELAKDPEFEARFIGEAKLAVKLTHANVVQVFDFGRFGGTLFIAMEFVDGLDLAALLKATRDRDERIPISAAFQIAIEIARGLDFAHTHQVVHRDVSPSNILLSRAGEVKIADFGIAQAGTKHRRERPGRRRIMGKWRYMSPEQTAGDPLSTQSDIFSAAAVMFELFTGDKLFPGDEAEEIIENIHHMTIPRASERRRGLPPRLDEILGEALQRDPDQRPRKLNTMVRALTEISYESSIVATALDVAETVAQVLGEDKKKPSEPTQGIDDLIRRQLSGAAPVHRRTAVDAEPAAGTGRGTGELARLPTDLATLDGDDSGVTGSATMVKRGVDADGLTLLEFEADDPDSTEHTIAAVPSAIRLGRQSGAHPAIDDTPPPAAKPSARVPILVLAAVIVVAGGLGGGWLLWGRGDHNLVVPARLNTDFDAGSPTTPREATLTIDSIPGGAEVWLDGNRLPGVTPTVAPVASGVAHRVELVATGYRPYAVEGIMVRPGDTFPIAPTLVPLLATLRVTTDPADARVKLAGESVGATPLERTNLTPARGVELTITKSGFQPVKQSIDLDPDHPTEISVVLRPAVRYGTISLYIDGGWANVYLDNRQVGRAPHKAISLPVGKHRLRLHNPHSDKQQFLDVVVEEKKVNYYRVEW